MPAEFTPLAYAAQLQILIALGTGCVLQCGDAEPSELLPGHAAVLPASVQACTLQAQKAVEVIRILGPGAVSTA